MHRILRGLLVELRFVPLLGTLLAVSLGLLAAGPLGGRALAFLADGFFLLYMVHFLDTYEDAFMRSEDRFKDMRMGHGASGLLTRTELRAGAALCALAYGMLTLVLLFQAGSAWLGFAGLMIGAFLIGTSYSRMLSWRLLPGLLAYPVGAVAALLAGALMQAGTLTAPVLVLGVSVGLALLGAKIWLDSADATTDRRTGKPNIARTLGDANALRAAVAFLGAGLATALLREPGLTHALALVPALLLVLAGFRKGRVGISLALGGAFALFAAEAGLLYLAM